MYHAAPFWPSVLLKRSANSLMGIPLCYCCFSLVDFNIFSLIFVQLINTCLGMFFLGLIVWDNSLCFLNLRVSFPMLGKLWAIISSRIFSGPFFSFWNSNNVIMAQKSNFFPFFFLLLFCGSGCHQSIFQLVCLCSFASFTLLLIPSSVFFKLLYSSSPCSLNLLALC